MILAPVTLTIDPMTFIYELDPYCLPICYQLERTAVSVRHVYRHFGATEHVNLVQHCTLYGNATHIANTRYRTTLASFWVNWVRTSYNQMKSTIR